MKPCDTLADLRREFKAVSSGVAGDTIWSAKALLFLCELMDERLPKRRAKRKPTAYQRFVGEHMRAGGSLQLAAAAWRTRKLRKTA